MRASLLGVRGLGTPPLTKSGITILEAISLGYTANEDGVVLGLEGVPLRGSPKKAGHISLSLPNPNGRAKCQPVLAHRFIMCYFNGVDALLHQCIRHLNGDPSDNRLSNLACGTFKENRADIPKEKLSEIGRNNAPRLVAQMRKLADADILSMRKMREDTGLSYLKISEKFGVSTMTAFRAITGQSWSNVK